MSEWFLQFSLTSCASAVKWRGRASATIENTIPRRSNPRAATRRLLRAPASNPRDEAIRKTIRQIPRGKVATYSQVAAAAGYPLYHRQVVQVLRKAGDSLPWQRVVGAGGRIRLMRHMAHEQRLRLEMEGVRFRGSRIDMEHHQHVFRTWEFPG